MPIDVAHIEIFVLLFIRLVSALAVLPIFRNEAIPPMVKAGLAAVLSFSLVPTLHGALPAPSGTIFDFAGLALKETACGILLGFAGQTLFYAVEVAGQMIGFQSGFSMVSSIDPNTEADSTVLTQVYNLFAMMIFLTLNGHHMMLMAVVDSLKTIPIGALSVDGRLAQWFTEVATSILADGVRLAAPLMVTLLLTDVALGILTRVAPTLNVFVLGFPLKIGLTLVMVSLTLGVVANIFTAQYSHFMQDFKVFERILVSP